MVRNQIHVKIGEVKTGSGTDILKATLGSCVGIAFLDRKSGRYGLAHCLLPDDPKAVRTQSAKYVTHAIPTLIEFMKLQSEDFKKLEVYLAGGGNMMEQLNRRNPGHIGQLNFAMAEKVLSDMGFSVTGSLKGGDQACSILVDCESGTVEMKRFDKISSKD